MTKFFFRFYGLYNCSKYFVMVAQHYFVERVIIRIRDFGQIKSHSKRRSRGSKA